MKKLVQWGIGILGVAAAVGIGYVGMGMISDAHSTDKVATSAKQQSSSEQQTDKPKQQKTIFQQIAGRDFWFTSGAGGWRTVMTINEDGTFSGKFTDSDMGYLNVSRVYVTAKLWKVQANVKIKAGYSGSPKSGYQVESVSTTPNVVSVAGSEEALAALKEQNNTITIPDYVADISDRDSDFEEKINISDYLPDGLKLTSDSSEDMFIRVNVLPIGSSVCEVPTKNIVVNHAPDGMQVSFDTANIEVRVQKTDSSLDDLTEDQIKASIDLSDVGEGSHEVPVSIEIPDGYELVDDVTTGVEVSVISTAEENN